MGDGAFDAPPPLGGLGNFKGVMLCNRPSETSATGPGAAATGDGVAPFKSMSAPSCRETVGLTPCRSFEPTVKKRGPSAALRRHVRWLKELQGQMQQERYMAEEDEKEAEDRKQKMKASFEKHREAVREMIQARDAPVDAVQQTGEPKADRPERSIAKKADRSVKPLWAMTEEEKDKFEEDEADDLIGFAENLDYEKLLGDLEIRQGLAALKDRHGKLRKEQEAFKDALVADFNAKVAEEEERSTSVGSPRGLEDGIEGASAFGDLKSEYSVTSSRRSGGRAHGAGAGGKLEWDASTNCGEDRPDIDLKVKDAVDMVMESAPQMKQIHSKESMQKIIEKTKVRQAAEQPDLIAHMNAQDPVPVPVIVSSEDACVRLHKPVDPSLLPYLYRSPAV